MVPFWDFSLEHTDVHTQKRVITNFFGKNVVQNIGCVFIMFSLHTTDVTDVVNSLYNLPLPSQYSSVRI